MTFSLHAIPDAGLRALAASSRPDGIARHAAADALPPPFVALRALALLSPGESSPGPNTFYIVRDRDRLVVGSCGFKHAPIDGRVEIGYGVSMACRNEGAATAAVRELLRLAFARDGVIEVLAQIHPANDASAQVVRKLAFERGGLTDDGDEVLVQWLASKTSVAA
ncbi:MAG: GNAT family N-acetyltransferase [Janthinobacterium lividum]